MKERPILFSGSMVRALLAGTKTQTRRVVKMKPHQQIEERGDGTPWPWMYDSERDADAWLTCPYGKPGDRLWVRESWKHIEGGNVYDAAGGVMDSFEPETLYRASRPNYPGQWKPSIHMPRWASRITLEITSVRVERLQGISEADALAEGVAQAVRDRLPVQQCGEYDAIDVDPLELYRDLWESINGTGSWGPNPWVWVLEFRRIDVERSPC